ncbi:MAG: hypothetical protein KF784_05860 [Fimbriimonadaceae bacterium]|nr:hypothetical protein [Fimbriimonadaceae bacterium]
MELFVVASIVVPCLVLWIAERRGVSAEPGLILVFGIIISTLTVACVAVHHHVWKEISQDTGIVSTFLLILPVAMTRFSRARLASGVRITYALKPEVQDSDNGDERIPQKPR